MGSGTVQIRGTMTDSNRTWRRIRLAASAIALAGVSAGARTVKIWPGVGEATTERGS